MNKAELVSDVVARTGLPRKEVVHVVNAFLESLKQALVEGRRIELRGFGVFEPKRKKRRIGRNPQTLETVVIPERVVIHFKPSRIIQDLLVDPGSFRNKEE